MALIVILTLTGIMLGAASPAGWLAGGVLGAISAQIISLMKRVKRLEQDLSALHQERALQHLQQPAPSRQPPAAPSQVAEAELSVAAVKDEKIPLAVRIQALEPGTPDAHPAPAPAKPEPSAQPTAVAPNPAAAPAQPADRAHAIDNFFNKLTSTVNRFFTQGNPIVRIGMVVMFFGLGFLVKYAAANDLIPVELRLAGVAAIALALVILGWKTRTKPDGYGLVLQGGGIAALYLTVFAALKLFGLLPPAFALSLMLMMVILGAALAILQNAQVLALIATAGGFLAPILTSDGSGNHVALFSFYLLLNIGILAIAWFKTWRTLNWVGFMFTFVIASVWGVLDYQPQFYASTQPFLLAFFALYLTVAILFSLKQPPKLTGLVDGSLIFGLPIVAFGLQAALLKHTEYGVAISALVLAAVYTLLARLLWLKLNAAQRVLIESLLALGVTFATLAIPLALDAQWTSASWALEATGLIWVGLRQRRLLPRCAGYLLYVGAVVSLFRQGGLDTGMTPIVSGDFISLVLLALSAMCIAWLLHQFAQACRPVEKQLELVSLLVGWIWWLVAGVNEVEAHTVSHLLFAAAILFFAASSFILMELSRRLQWPSLSYTGYWLLPLTTLWLMAIFLVIGSSQSHPLQNFGWLALATFLIVQYRFLRLQEGQARQGLLTGYHVVTAWLIVGVIFWEAYWWQGEYQWQGTSSLVLWLACIALPLVAIMRLVNKTFWPFDRRGYGYKNIVPAPLLFLLILWFLKACSYPGITAFPYIPGLNPLDLAQLAAVILLAYAMKYDLMNLRASARELRYGIIGGAIFVWLNVVLLRTIHHFGDVAYSATPLWHSATVQMGLSILWTLSALVIMNLARRVQERRAWIAGAILLGMVVLKLFTQDLSGNGTLARIVSFMVVGALMLLIGYLSPMPGKDKAQPQEERAQ